MRFASALAIALAATPAWAQIDDAVWMLKTDGEEAFLAYGTPDSDDGRIALSCRKGSAKVTVMAPVTHRIESSLDAAGQWRDAQGRPNPWPVPVTLRSGTVTADQQGQAHPDEMNGGSTVDVDLKSGAPILRAFARSGRLSLTAYGETVNEPPAPRSHVSAFLKACG